MPIKVGILSPARDKVDTGFAFDMGNLTGYTVSCDPGIHLGAFTSLGTMIFDQRIKLAREAVAEKCDYLFWLDTDMRFPKDTLLRLLAHNKDIVAANYVTRQVPPEPVSFMLTDEGKIWRRVPTFPDERNDKGEIVKTGSTGLEKVSGAPFGCMLVRAEVFKKIDKPDVPMFWFQYSTKNHTVLGEDIYWCLNVARYGYEIWIDHDLSKQIKHIGTFEFGHEHVDGMALQQMRAELDAAVMVDLNQPTEAPPIAPVIPLRTKEPYVGAEGMHKDVIGKALAEERETVKNLVNITGA